MSQNWLHQFCYRFRQSLFRESIKSAELISTIIILTLNYLILFGADKFIIKVITPSLEEVIFGHYFLRGIHFSSAIVISFAFLIHSIELIKKIGIQNVKEEENGN